MGKLTFSLTKRLAAGLRRFRRDEHASLSVEAVLITPLLFWALAASFTYFDLFRERSLAIKGNYAVSDLISRESRILDMTYLNGTRDVYRYLTGASSGVWLRLTVVRCAAFCADESQRQLNVEWSHATDGEIPLTNDAVANHYADLIPMMAQEEVVIMLESNMTYQPRLSPALTGIGETDFTDVVLTRPRFSGQVCWENTSCGS